MAKKLTLSGNVQGVFCREYCRQNAVRLGLQGAASNVWDGTVKILLDTDDDALISTYIETLNKNPYGIQFNGKINNIEIEDYTGSIRGDSMF
ncbi:MAG: acylphosphatase [Spirochaetota bacterium]|nr:acylphosphatase [Spirochaetota bacterium]